MAVFNENYTPLIDILHKMQYELRVFHQNVHWGFYSTLYAIQQDNGVAVDSISRHVKDVFDRTARGAIANRTIDIKCKCDTAFQLDRMVPKYFEKLQRCLHLAETDLNTAFNYTVNELNDVMDVIYYDWIQEAIENNDKVEKFHYLPVEVSLPFVFVCESIRF